MNKEIKIKDITDCLEIVAPLHWQEDYDNAGLIIGNKEEKCTGVIICLDVFKQTLLEAIDKGCNMIVAHHPFIYKGLKKIDFDRQINDILKLAFTHNIAIYAAHTNMDNAKTGVSYMLSKALEVENICRLEKSRFPNEENFWGGGAIGELKSETMVKEYLLRIKKNLGIGAIKYIGDEKKKIKRIGFCGGSGSFLIENAIDKGCDIYLTGDLKYHDYLSNEDKIVLADIGHFESEKFIKQRFFDIISEKICNFAPLYLSDENNRVKFI